uniref:Replication protein A C-terminal domain-containing protein n=2 Tax=Rhizochromulina marina TaxID=1034831 RepID=A0A7S2SSA9_9STRA
MSTEGGFDYGSTGGFGGFGGPSDGLAFGGGSGGGFMASQTDGASPGTKKASRDRQTVIPFTIRQIKGATIGHADDPVKIDGVELAQVRLVANVMQVTEQSTYVVYDVEDCTGMIQVKMWNDQDENEMTATRRAACRQGVYVRIHAYLKVFNGQISVTAVDIRPVEDQNEITCHMLEAIYIHLQHTQGPKQAPATAAGWNSTSSGFGTGGFNPPPGNNLSSTMALEGVSGNSGFTPVQAKALEAVNQIDSMDGPGVHVQAIVQQLGTSGFDAGAVRAAVEFLASEGHLYSTVDEEHYKVTCS